MKTVIKRTIFIFFSLLSSLFIAEIVLKVSGFHPEYGYPKGLFRNDEILGYSLASDFSDQLVRHEFTTKIETNSDGLADSEVSPKKPGEYRILFLGDSFTFARYGAEAEQTFPKILERKLRENSKKDFRVINAGVPGYDTYLETLYLKNRGIDFTPDMVILNFFVGNDFLENVQNHDYKVRDGFLSFESGRENFLTSVRFFLLSRFYTYNIFEKGVLSIFNSLQEKARENIRLESYQSNLYLTKLPENIKYQYEKTVGILEEMKNFLAKKNIPLVLVIIPADYQVDEKLKSRFSDKYYNNVSYDLTLPQKKLSEWGVKTKIQVIDLLPQMKELSKNNDFYWTLNGHFNVKGNEVVGDIIYYHLSSFFNFPLPENNNWIRIRS